MIKLRITSLELKSDYDDDEDNYFSPSDHKRKEVSVPYLLKQGIGSKKRNFFSECLTK